MEISISYFILGMAFMTMLIMAGGCICSWIKLKRVNQSRLEELDHCGLVSLINLIKQIMESNKDVYF